MGGVSCNLACTPQGPGGLQILETWEVAANHLLSRVNDTLQSDLVPGRSSSVLDGDGGGEDGLDDGLKGRDMLPQFNVLHPVGQEVCDPPAGGVRHTQLGNLVLKKSWDYVVEGRAEVHKRIMT